MITLRLAAADLTDSWRIWTGAFLLAAGAVAASAVPATLVSTATAVRGVEGLALASIAGTGTAFTLIALISVLSPVMRLTVTLRQRTIALWQSVGVLPRTVALVVLTQVAIVSALGGACGGICGYLIAPELVRRWLTASAGLDDVPVALSGSTCFVFAGVAIGVAVAGSVRAAARITRTSVAQTLRGARTRRSRWVGTVTAALLCCLLAQMLSALPASVPSGAAPSALIGAVVVATVAALGTLISVPLLKSWTRLLEIVAPVMVIARAGAVWSSEQSSTVLTALLVAIGIPSALEAGRSTAGSALATHSTTNSGALFLVLAGPVLLGAAGAAAVAFMSSTQRSRETAALGAMGASRSFRLTAAAVEGLFLAVTGAFLATIATFTTAFAEWAVVAGTYPSAVPVIPVGTLLTITSLTTPLVVAATTLPAAADMKRFRSGANAW